MEMLTEEYLDAGIPREEAARRARLRLGKSRNVIERVRDQELSTALEGWYRDLVLAFRTLRKTPVFCLTAILTLALGIGANTAIFTLLYGLLLRSLPVKDAQRLARVSIVTPQTEAGTAMGFMLYPMSRELRRHAQSYTGVSEWMSERLAITDSDGGLRFQAGNLVSGNAFETLGLYAHRGRLIGPEDDVRGGIAGLWPLVISYGFWRDRFGADEAVLGKTLQISNQTATVIGVAPPAFHGVAPGEEATLYLPIHFANALHPELDVDAPNAMFGCQTLARLRPNVSLRQANAELAVYANQLLGLMPPALRSRPPFDKAALRVDSARTGFPSFFGHTYSEPLRLMQGLVLAVLLLCCVNVGGLMMSMVYARRHEFAVRTAVGGARWRLIRQYLVESFVLGAAGAALGGFVAWRGNGVLLHFFRHPMIGQWMAIEPDSTVLLVTGACALLTTMIFGLVPALSAGRTDPAFLLKSRTGGARKGVGGRAFVPVQVAFALALVTMATLLSQSLTRLRAEHTGFELERVTIQTAPISLLRKQGDARLDLYQRMVDRIRELPGVESAAVTWQTPMTGVVSLSTFQAASGAAPADDVRMAFNQVGPGYFRTMKTKILAGREFDPGERDWTICILNQAAAASLFPHTQPLGAYVRSADPQFFPQTATCRVVGIAEDAKFWSLREPPPRTIYLPIARNARTGNLVFLIRSATKAESVAAYRKALGEIAPTVPLVLFATLGEQMDAALGSQSLITAMSDFFGGLSLLLSAIGLYGLLASSVAQRTAEIGVRMALGARRSRVVATILADALRLVGIGLALGCLILIPALRLVRDLLYGVSASDPLSWAAAAAALGGAALAAALIPALRAASVDPIQALRL
jgi:predicted permease